MRGCRITVSLELLLRLLGLDNCSDVRLFSALPNQSHN